MYLLSLRFSADDLCFPLTVLGTVDHSRLEGYTSLDYLPFDANIKRTEGTVRQDASGSVFKTTKGAPHIISNLLSGDGSGAAKAAIDGAVHALAEKGIRSLAVARTLPRGPSGGGGAAAGGDEWHAVGLLTFLDPPRPDTAATLHKAIFYGVEIKMARAPPTQFFFGPIFFIPSFACCCADIFPFNTPRR